MSNSRATQAELLKRREEIRALIVSGVKTSVIKSEMAIKWETSARAISEDMRIIAKEWEEIEPEKVQASKNKFQERLEHMFSEAMQADNLKLALEIQKEINKLGGLYAEKDQKKEEMPKFVNVSRRSDLKVVGESE